MEPTTLLPAIALLSLVTVESGGWALLGFITARRGALDAAQHQAFRAGHAHAGVLLVLALAAFALFARAEASVRAPSGYWARCCSPGSWRSPVGSSCTSRSESRPAHDRDTAHPSRAPSSSPSRSRGWPLACCAPDRWSLPDEHNRRERAERIADVELALDGRRIVDEHVAPPTCRQRQRSAWRHTGTGDHRDHPRLDPDPIRCGPNVIIDPSSVASGA